MRTHRSLALGGPLLLALATPALAQGPAPRFFVSTTSDVAGGGAVPAVSDGDIVLVQEGAAAAVTRTLGNWYALTGDDVGDVDGLARVPGSTPGSAASIAFSVVSSFGGFLDGDVLRLKPGGGIEVLIAEDVLTQGLGLATGSIDLDAMAWDSLGRFHFSVESDASGTTLGDLLDGDVLRLEPDGSVKRVLTEIDVEDKLTLATGSTAAIGDVIGLEMVGTEAFVVIQSPSAYDGGVLDCGITPVMMLTDTGAGLGGAEIDALMLVGEDDVLPSVRTEPSSAASGATVHVEFRGNPFEGLLVIWSGASGALPFFGPGFGSWYVDPTDPWLNSIFSGPTLPLVPLNASGFYGIDYTLPLGVEGVGLDGKLGWTFQTMALATLELSEPFRLELL